MKKSFIFILLSGLLSACEKKDLPFLGATRVSGITMYTANVQGYVMDEGSSPVTTKGICWDTTGNPTTEDFVLKVEGAGGGISGKLTLLLPGKKYYVRCFAVNKAGTGYSQAGEFTTVPVGIPAVGTMNIMRLTTRSVMTGVATSGDYAVYVTRKGVCYGTEPSPSVENSIIQEIPGSGWYYATLGNLAPSTTYYVRGFATTKAGTGYGEQIRFTTYKDSVTDIDGNKYYTTMLGNREWLGSNLCVSKYNNGDAVVTTDPSTVNISSETDPRYQWPYLGDASKVKDYGRYYTWYAVNDSRRLCPDGWHVPSEEEWDELINWYGGYSKAGDPMKLISILWAIYHLPYNYDSGFNASGSGYRKPEGIFAELRQSATFWSSVSFSPTEAYNRRIEGLTPVVTKAATSKSSGFQVRCVKD